MEGRPAALDMSLDDVIKSKPGGRGRGRGGRRRTGNMQQDSKRSRNYNRRNDNFKPKRNYNRQQQRQQQSSSPIFNIINDRYKSSSTSSSYDNNEGIITVSNLFHEVTKDDLFQLFSQIGPIKNVKIQFDRAGRSNGIATIIFINKKDAMIASDKFHHVPLDGHPMQISLKNDQINNQSQNQNLNRRRIRGGGGGVERREGREGYHHDRYNNRERSPGRSRNLDADLDEYMMKN